MPTHHSDSSAHPALGAAGQKEKIGREVVCKICEAVYVPSRTHRRLAHSPQAVVESAFMSMCHFCFRCRRPACPSCWDDVHDVCGACALEAQLPFRSNVPPLDGVVFPPIHDLQLARVRTLAPPLVCIQPGCFQRAPLPFESRTTLYLQAISDQPIYDLSKKHPSPNIPTPSSKPRSNVIENVQSITPVAPALPPLRSPVSKSHVDIEDVATRPEKRDVQSESKGPVVKTEPAMPPVNSEDVATRPEKRDVQSESKGPVAKSGPAKAPIDVADVATRPEKRRVHSQGTGHETVIRRDRLERTVAEIVLLFAFPVILLMACALFSPSVNDGIAYLLHVDIRAGIAYLLQLIQHLF